ncbi:ATP-dependent RNA helicase prh1, putative [Plasmodium knowlesi strain H]|uniref:ATP-dependent RNA helicase prh1, putative n=3 Tax=Plasmodium knowlesi TaxID=5850 RepID=A0A5K1TZ06_PLAKH|nr:ATP-dependent RNA helicase DHX36, putative [Plasmodium knowlesi strain H]OTN67901.1 putative ATP-dependent RNA helicase prh1 [Plasmodium knowlesi]CAA9990191.1 ATP-dependent RNA helicase DHX36, putative [Plasmodium knowlesi strain H]SBO27473.1 ATP-dependent RNA helicase prh1, putative [Plasmodium knowlesi strain H]SBO28485.1 ATP-dependent RNA helicase prh1, putative [Plasmodium knowlesi strain H]VVS79665.1 ATP-dependent RNA helicase DHX36, putative [Plasmodium knowlesi strain H]|eukprot:XP_002258110.1 ATP-dependent RNA helicase prh1, putative [Plasmodium knowlesi strain H]
MIDLPILKHKKEIKKCIKRNRLIIIKGETGCGKTTQVPQIINRYFFDKRRRRGSSDAGKDGAVCKDDNQARSPKEKAPMRMLVSLPRRVATITVAERVAKEMDRGHIGTYVGYAIRFKNVTSDDTRIKFVTDGILIREIMNDPLLKKYTFLILDEVHERSIRTDVLLGYVRTLMEKRKKLRIILMSATLDVDTFKNFFSDPPIISIPHKLHPVSIFYPMKPVEDYLISVVCTVLQIHFGQGERHDGRHDVLKDDQSDDQPDDQPEERLTELTANTRTDPPPIGDVLVFLPGQEEIEAVNLMLKEKLKIIYKGSLLRKLIENRQGEEEEGEVLERINVALHAKNPIEDGICFHLGHREVVPDKIYAMKILQLYSSLPNRKQRIVFEPAPPNTRKVILSTNIAETSVTIPNIKYVVDSGRVKIKFFDAKKGSSVLKVTQISKDAAIQRSGRAGREGPGQVYRVYSKEEYDSMNPFLIPEIFRSDLTQIYLELKAMNIANPLKFNFPENPKKELLLHSAKVLFRINAIDVENNLTDLGKKMCLLPLNPIYANMMLCSVDFHCMDEVATIVAFLNCESIFLNYNFYEDFKIMNEESAGGSLACSAREKRDNQDKGDVLDKDDATINAKTDESFEPAVEEDPTISDRNKLINIARRKLMHPDGDHLTLLHIFYLWQEEATPNERKDFCNIYALNNETLQQVQKIKEQILQIMTTRMGMKISPKLHMHKWDQVLICLCKSCFFNVARSTSNTNEFINVVTKSKLYVHPSSTLFSSHIKASFIFYSDIVQTKRLYARTVTKVDGDWLLKYAPQNFQLVQDSTG